MLFGRKPWAGGRLAHGFDSASGRCDPGHSKQMNRELNRKDFPAVPFIRDESGLGFKVVENFTLSIAAAGLTFSNRVFFASTND
jgi:hypothetical protein